MAIDSPPLRWGIVGAGGIAQKLTEAVQRFTTGSVVAVAERDRSRAQAFAARYGIPAAYGGDPGDETAG